MVALSCRLPRKPRKHTVLRIPESHTLFVGPPACMRRHAFRARDAGLLESTTFLRITQADVVSGGYEDLTAQAVDEIFRMLDPAPRIMFVVLFCIDDFLGTDDAALVERLSGEHPNCKFVVDHIHPIAITGKAVMSATKISNHYSFIDPVPESERDNGINVVGVFAPFCPESELHDVLSAMGVGPLRYAFDCDTYEGYQAMGKSRVALLTRGMNLAVAREMQERLGIPYVDFPPCYSIERIAVLYGDIARALGGELPEMALAAWRARAQQAVDDALSAAQGVALAVDCEASLVPHALALALLEYGFDVRWLFRSKHMLDDDANERDRLIADHPEVEIMRVDDANLLVGNASFDAAGKAVLAIGEKAASIFKTSLVVDMWHDEGFTGYHGVCKLMQLIGAQAKAAKGSAAMPGSDGTKASS